MELVGVVSVAALDILIVVVGASLFVYYVWLYIKGE